MSRIEADDTGLETDIDGFLVDVKGHSTRWKPSDVTIPPARGMGLHSFAEFQVGDRSVLVGNTTVDELECFEAVLLIRSGRVAAVRSVIYLIL